MGSGVFMGDGQVHLDQITRTIKELNVVEVDGAQRCSIAVQTEVEHERHLVEHAVGQSGKIPFQLLPFVGNGGHGVDFGGAISFELDAHQRPLNGCVYFHANGADFR